MIGRVGVLDLADEYHEGSGGRLPKRKFDIPFKTLLAMRSRGPVFVADSHNQMFQVRNIDEQTRRVEFSGTPTLPKNVAEQYSGKKINKYAKQEFLNRLKSRGVSI